MAHDIIVLGVFVVDAAFRCDRLPNPGETRLGVGFALGPGGKGSNQAVAAARAGGDVGFITRVGRDAFAQIADDAWAGAGGTALAARDGERPTGAAGIFIDDRSGQNAIVVSPGAAAALGPSDIDAHASHIAAARVAMTQLEQSMVAAEHFLRRAHAGGAATILNPAPAAEIGNDVLSLCDYLTPNETEAEGLTGQKVADLHTAEAAARDLMARGVRRGVIVTLGPEGALAWDGARATHLPPMTAGAVVDTTGAGDAFNGGFAAALAEGRDMLDALRFATATASVSVTRPGTAASMPTRAEIEALLKRQA